MELSEQVGRVLKEARKFKGLTQKEVASLLLMTQQQYSRFETGKFELNYQQIVKLCEILDITPNDLFDK
ncbi:MAG: helix-turn-helix transcriptional regulator [Clostridia bacterium]|nr:helix-turn-helix transcriptional regulator [Clostridia bacterium]MBQ8792413.1 helix-turn-helix transcriptional regulator [Clostridia bacterium]